MFLGVRQILISVVVTEPRDDAAFSAAMPEVAREIGDTMMGLGLGVEVEAVAVAHSSVVVNPQRLDGQTIHDHFYGAHEESHNASTSGEVKASET